MTTQVPTPQSLPPAGITYDQILRAGRPGWWRPIVGVLALLALLFVVAPFAMQLPFVAYYAATGQDVVDKINALINLKDPTPASLAYLNLVLASAIPLTWLLIRGLHGLKPRWLSSVGPRLRWQFFAVCLVLSLLSLMITVAVASLIPQQPGTPVGGEVRDFTSTTRDFLLVVLFLTPLQAAGEEYAFRGYLLQALGSLPISRPMVVRSAAVLVSALLFALAHGAGQGWPIFIDRFAFGLVAGVLVILTGGLEAGIAMHVLNNFVAFGLALAFSDMATALNPTGGSWWGLISTMTQSISYLLMATWAARTMKIATTYPRRSPETQQPVLEGPTGRV